MNLSFHQKHSVPLSPKVLPSPDLSFDSKASPEECLDKILQNSINLDSKSPSIPIKTNPTQTIITMNNNSLTFSTLNDYKPESEYISECHLELDNDDLLNQKETQKGLAPLSKTSCFLLRFSFLHYFIYLLNLSWNVIKKKEKLSFRHLQFLSEEQRIDKDLQNFIEKFNAEVERNHGSISEWRFMFILLIIFRRKLFNAYFFWTLNICICFMYSLFIDKLLHKYQTERSNPEKYYWALALGIGFFLQYITGSWGWYTVCEFNTKFRLLLINSLYLKVMKLNNFSIQKANIGKIINIIANDMNTVEFKFVYLIFLLTAPLTLILSLYLLWRKLGLIGLIAIPILAMMYYIQRYLSSTNMKNIRQKNVFSDERMKFCNELIEGIKLLKVYAWETTVKRFIDEIREKEIKALTKYSHYVYGDRALSVNATFIVCLVLFFVYAHTNNYLDSSVVFSIYQLMEYIRIYQVSYVGFGLSFFFEFKVISRRIIDILNIKETHQIDYLQDLNLDNNNSNLVMKAENFTGYWDTDPNSKPVISNISLKIERKKKYAIIGKVGSGKSSFFHSILREIPKATGTIQIKGSLAYVEQEPFIIHGTVRSNILFFKEFNEQLYRKVLRVSCLEKDLLEFPQKDLTEIGERGLNLSGGQKARISLARALYSEADIYLLDDPLSALDAKVGKKIFDLTIKKFLKKKTVILITHQIQFLNNVDHIFLFDEGKLVKEGNFMSFKHDLSHFFENHEVPEIETPVEDEKTNNEPVVFQRNPGNKTQKKLYDNQEDADAQVSLMTYLQFVKFSNNLFMGVFCFVLFILFEGSKYCTSFFYSLLGPDDTYPDITNQTVFISVFAILLAQLLISFFKYFCFVKMVLSSNKNIHKKMTEGIVRAPAVFFDTHHSGSILNRFSNDIGLMDGLLILTLIDFFDLSLTFISGIIISGSISLWFFIPGSIAMVFLYKIFVFAKPVILELKKMDLQNKSPIFGFFSSTLTGLTSINVYKRNQNFIDQYSKLIENSARCNNNFWEVSRGFGFAVENISKITSVVGLYITLLFTDNYTGQMGQQIIYLLLISDTLQWGLRQAINAESVMSSTVRALKFTELIPEDLLYKPKDRDLVNNDQWIQSVRNENEEVRILPNPMRNTLTFNELKGHWPNQGQIEFSKVSLRYRDDLDLTLHDLSFKIMPGEKIGVVGRTGAGKSSIIQALFRMVETSQGKILIDGTNIKEIGLHTLRGNMSIIPQNPFVFMGSVRRNIDPMGINTDEEVMKALENVELKEHIDKLEKGIDSDMSYAKSVFSVGQKQLLCLARTILKKNKILVLDEATANVDLDTDILIQKKIKELFKSCTILTVAHRLLTIADYDKVLVLERGRVVEFNEPFLLLTSEEKQFEISKKGFFADMVLSMGTETAKLLLETTKSVYFAKRGVRNN